MSGPWAPTPTRWASGAGALPSAGWTGLYDEPRSGTPRKIGDERIAEIISRTLEETQPDSTHWSLRSMARASGYAPSTIHRIWQAFGLQPHRPVGLNLSSDPLFVAKVRDIVEHHNVPCFRIYTRNNRARPRVKLPFVRSSN